MTFYSCAVPLRTAAATNLAGWQADRLLLGQFVLQASVKPISPNLTGINCCQVHSSHSQILLQQPSVANVHNDDEARGNACDLRSEVKVK